MMRRDASSDSESCGASEVWATGGSDVDVDKLGFISSARFVGETGLPTNAGGLSPVSS